MSTDNSRSGGSRLPAAAAVWKYLKPICLLAGLLLVCVLLITVEAVIRL